MVSLCSLENIDFLLRIWNNKQSNELKQSFSIFMTHLLFLLRRWVSSKIIILKHFVDVIYTSICISSLQIWSCFPSSWQNNVSTQLKLLVNVFLYILYTNTNTAFKKGGGLCCKCSNHDTKHYDIRYNDIEHMALNIRTFSGATTLRIMLFNRTINKTQLWAQVHSPWAPSWAGSLPHPQILDHAAMPMTNTLAYLAFLSVMKKKSFITGQSVSPTSCIVGMFKIMKNAS